MKAALPYSLVLIAALTLVLGVWTALAADEAAQSPAAGDEVSDFAADCEQMSVDGPTMVLNAAEGEPAPMATSQCNCTLPGTSIPPGELGIKCASPIGGPLVRCRNVLCFTSIHTPWINGVCG